MLKIVSSFLVVLWTALLLSSCNEKEEVYQAYKIHGEAQGTTYSIVYYDTTAQNVQPAIDSLLHAIDLSMSTYIPNSLISEFNQADSCVEIDEMFLDVFFNSAEIHEATKGAFDPTVKHLVNIWGFGYQDTLKNKTALSDSQLIELRDSLAFEWLDYVGFDKIVLGGDALYDDIAKVEDPLIYICKPHPQFQLDFNAIAQGYSVDRICYLLDGFGIKSYLVELGGELRAKGSKPYLVPWKVGIENPTLDPENPFVATMDLGSKALATSGSYRKFYKKNGKRYSHTIDPRTGMPVKHSLLSVSVVANTCVSADAYATAFMVMGLEESVNFVEANFEKYGLEAYFIYENEQGQLESYTTYGLKSLIDMDSTMVQEMK